MRTDGYALRPMRTGPGASLGLAREGTGTHLRDRHPKINDGNQIRYNYQIQELPA